jgi:hypothetical protein
MRTKKPRRMLELWMITLLDTNFCTLKKWAIGSFPSRSHSQLPRGDSRLSAVPLPESSNPRTLFLWLRRLILASKLRRSSSRLFIKPNWPSQLFHVVKKLQARNHRRSSPMPIKLRVALRNEVIRRRMPSHYESLSMSAKLGNFRRCPQILAEIAKIGGYFQRFSRLADICRNYQNWRTFAEMVTIGGHLEWLLSLTHICRDCQVWRIARSSPRQWSHAESKKIAQALLLDFNANLLARALRGFFNTKRQVFRLPAAFHSCDSHSTSVNSLRL